MVKHHSNKFRVHFLAILDRGTEHEHSIKSYYDIACSNPSDAASSCRKHVFQRYGSGVHIVIGKTKVLRNDLLFNAKA